MPPSALDTYYALQFRGNRLYGQLARLLGESPQTLFLMRLLRTEEEGMCQADICESLSTPKQTMSRILKDMEGRGYVQERPSPRDGREKLYRLTPEGRSHAERLIERLNEVESTGTDAMCGNLDTVNELNRRYLDALEQCVQNLRKEH